METQPDIQQELLKQQQQLQQLMQEQPKEEQVQPKEEQEQSKEEQERPEQNDQPKQEKYQPKQEQSEQVSKPKKKTLKMPLKGKKHFTSITDKIEHEMTMKILKQVQVQFQNSDDMARLVALHKDVGEETFSQMFYDEMVDAKHGEASTNGIANNIFNQIIAEKKSLVDMRYSEFTKDNDNEGYAIREFTCVLCNGVLRSKQSLQLHYLDGCSKLSNKKFMKTKDFNFIPTGIPEDEIESIIGTILVENINYNEATHMGEIENLLIRILEEQYINYHIRHNNNIYVANKKFEENFYIIVDGIWKKVGNANTLCVRAGVLFDNFIKCVRDTIMVTTIMSLSKKDRIAEILKKMVQLMADKTIKRNIAKRLFYVTSDNIDKLKTSFDNSFQH